MKPFMNKCAIVTAVALVAGCSTDGPSTPTSLVFSNAQASLEAPYQVSASKIEIEAGQSYQLEATKAANGKLVPETSIRWITADPSIATISDAGRVTGVSEGQTVVSAVRGAHQVDVQVQVGCVIGVLPLGTTTGEITKDDCLFHPVPGRRTDYYRFTLANGEVNSFVVTAEFIGPFGVKAETVNPRIGTVFGSRNLSVLNGMTNRMRVIGNGDLLQFFLSGNNGAPDSFGAYSITRSVQTQAHGCGMSTFVVPGASFATTLNQANSCVYNVAFTNFPPALGKPLHAHRYWVRLDELKPYTITINGLSNTFDPALTVFPNIFAAPPVAQSFPTGGAQSTRSVTFTPPARDYYLIEVASGRFIGDPSNPANWANETGSFTLSVSR